jgi:LacI family transcriptional regulator, galactose operon repressor
MVTVKDVARRAGVSIGTVSNVLNRPAVVAESTRERVLAAVAELGFVRNESARTLRAGRSRTVAVVVADSMNPFFADVARGAAEVADEHGALSILCSSWDIQERERDHLQSLEAKRVAGILITPVDADAAWLNDVARRGTPIVFVDPASSLVSYCSVAVDDVLGGQIAVEHLVQQGHRRVAFVGDPNSTAQVRDRLQGARAAAQTAGITLVPITTSELTMSAGRAAVPALLGQQPPVTAAFCANDLVALGVMAEVRERGISIPDDLALVGYDDAAYSVIAAVPLSSVRQPREEMGHTAAELLFEEIAHAADHQHRQLTFGPELVVRGSSQNQPATASPERR